MLLIIWLCLSLLVLGIPCCLFAIVHSLYPTMYTHQWMWGCYVIWGRGLSKWVEYYIPKLDIQVSEYPKGPFIVIANHYCWLDILVLFAAVFRQSPFVFVMKKSLRYMPVIGFIAWLLGFPLIDRGAGKRNQRILQKSAESAKDYGYGIMIFPEGTRYVKSKKSSQYENVLTPRWRGLECLAKTFGDEVTILDATIVYEKKHPRIWDFALGRVGRVTIEVLSKKVSALEIESWLMAAWLSKDKRINEIQSQYRDDR